MEGSAETADQPANLVFEVQASALAADPQHWRAVCEWYRRNGCQLVLAYGAAGPVSVRTLLDIRPDSIKLEKSLIGRVETLRGSLAIRKLAELGERLGIPVVAHGVDRDVTKENLWLLNIYLMEGALF